MRTIAFNQFYEIDYDDKKNRIYYKVKGYWANVSKVPDYMKHIEEVLTFVKPNFTMLVDTTLTEPHPPEVEEIRKKAQKLAIEAGLLKAAEISSDNFVSAIQFVDMTQNTKFPINKFSKLKDAEDYLDNEVSKTIH